MLRGMEFLVSCSQNYFGGVVDLFCEHKGYLYLVSWSDDFPEKDHAVQAIKTYLSTNTARPFDEIFGGMFFLSSEGESLVFKVFQE